MRWFGRRKGKDDDPWAPPTEGACRCARHLDAELLGTVVPFSPDPTLSEDEQPMTVGELLDMEALACEPVEQEERMLADGTGPYHWDLWFGDEARLSYDDGAALPLDTAVAMQPGVERVAWLDREVLYVGAPRLCRSGALAAAAAALLDPGVRARS